MSDLKATLEQRSQRGIPIGSEQLRQRVATELAGPARRASSVSSGWIVVVATAAVVIVAIGGVTILLGGPEGAIPPAGEGTPNPPPTATVPIAPSSLDPAIPQARVSGVAFDFAEDDLCEWFTSDEILTIVANAYRAEGVDYPIPPALVPVGEGYRNDRQGCDWTVPGTPGGWGRPDFTVMFRDDSDYQLYTDTGRDGPTLLESFHDPSPDSEVQPLDEDILAGRGVLDLAIPGVVDVGGWSPGFSVYVEKADRLIDFRHDLAAGPYGLGTYPNGIEDYRIEYRILIEMLERMNWLPAP